MAVQINPFDYYYTTAGDEAAQTASIIKKLSQAGVNLVAFSEFPCGPGKRQLDLVAEDPAALLEAASAIGLELSDKKSGFLIRGEQIPGALADVLQYLAQADIGVMAMQAIAAGEGKFAALLWVNQGQFQPAAQLLAQYAESFDTVQESSEESFPASDPPAWSGEQCA